MPSASCLNIALRYRVHTGSFYRCCFTPAVASFESFADFERDPQQLVDYMSRCLAVRYSFLSKHHGQVTLRNVCRRDIHAGTWAIFFSHRTIVNPPASDAALAVLLENSTRGERQRMRVTSLAVAAGRMRLTHVDGDLYQLSPTDHFDMIPAGHGITCQIHTTSQLRTRSDVFPNW